MTPLKVTFFHSLVLFTPYTDTLLTRPRQRWHNRFREIVKLICLRETVATSRLSAIKRAWVKFNWMRWVATVDTESCCTDEMDSLWRLKIMSFTQSAWEGIQPPVQLLPRWCSGVWQGQTGQIGVLPMWSIERPTWSSAAGWWLTFMYIHTLVVSDIFKAALISVCCKMYKIFH